MVSFSADAGDRGCMAARAAVLALPRPRQLALLLAHLNRPRRVGGHLRLRHAADLAAAPVRARDPGHAELARQLTLHSRGGDRLQRAEDPAHTHGVQGTPFPVAEGPGDPRDLIVNVILGIALPARALQPRGHDQPGGLKPPRLAAVNPDAVIAGAGDPSPGLQILQRRPVGPVQHLLERLLLPGPVRSGLLVAALPGAALVLAQGGM